MAGAWTTKTIKDGGGNNLTMRVWDESGAGTGPFSFGQVLTDGTDGGQLAVGELLEAIEGTVADGADDAGGSAKVGGAVHTAPSSDTMLADAKRAHWAFAPDQFGYVRTVALDDRASGSASNTDGTSTEVIAAAGANIKLNLTHVSLSNTHATTGVMVALKSGAVSRWRVYVPPAGRELKFDPPLAPNAANEAWNFDPDSAVTTIECSMNGFKTKA